MRGLIIHISWSASPGSAPCQVDRACCKWSFACMMKGDVCCAAEAQCLYRVASKRNFRYPGMQGYFTKRISVPDSRSPRALGDGVPGKTRRRKYQCCTHVLPNMIERTAAARSEDRLKKRSNSSDRCSRRCSSAILSSSGGASQLNFHLLLSDLVCQVEDV